MSIMNKLIYRDDPVPEQIYEAARDAAAHCGYDPFEEVLLDCKVLDIRWISGDSAREFYAEFLVPPCSFSSEEIVRIEWLTWSVPKQFDGSYEKAVIARSESIVVAVSTLMNREVFTYGLGPEYNWLEWQEGSPPPSELPTTVFEALGQLIVGDWLEDVQEHADGEPSYIKEIHPQLQAFVAKAIS